MLKNFLKQIRQEKGIKQADLARKAGLFKQNISDFEKGKQGFSKESLDKISAVLDVSVNHILTGESDESIDKKSRARLEKAMTLAGFRVDLGKEMTIKIAAEIFNLLTAIDSFKSSGEKKKFLNSLESKYITGLAAQCLLNSKKNASKK